MSRREIPAKQPGDTVFVGWDRPMLTFFGQAYRAELPEDDNPVFWVGAARPRELDEVEDLALALRPYADLSHEMRATLRADRSEGR